MVVPTHDNPNPPSASIADLPIDPATAQAALDELGLTEAAFWALDADGFQAVIDAHGARVKAWKLREDARIDQIEAARASVHGVPKGMSIWHAGAEGLIDPGTARDALQTVYRLQQEQDTDPAPDAPAVLALLNAVFANAQGTGSAEA